MTIVHREGEYAWADLHVLSSHPPLPPDPSDFWVTFKQTKGSLQSLLCGRLISSMPGDITGTKRIRVIAKSGTTDEDLQSWALKFRQPPFWDPLFVDDQHKNNMDEICEGLDGFPYVDRVTHQITLSALNEGCRHWTLDHCVLEDSVVMKIKSPPFEKVNFMIHAEWMQQCQGEEDLTDPIKKSFQKGAINTLTPHDFQHRWKHTFAQDDLTGYQVLESQLNLLKSSESSITSLVYPQCSVPLRDKDKYITLPRTWYHGTLRVGWTWKQPRRETLALSVSQKTTFQTERVKSLVFRLQSPVGYPDVPSWSPGTCYKKEERVIHHHILYRANTGHHASLYFMHDQPFWDQVESSQNLDMRSPSFFDTPRGIEAVRHAITRARCYLSYSARCLWVSMTVPFEDGWAITPQDTASFQHPDIPEKTVRGKVVSYHLEIDGQTGRQCVHVILACRVGLEDDALSEEKKTSSDYVDDQYMQNEKGAVPFYDQGIFVGSLVKHPSSEELTPQGSIVKRIDVYHEPEEQQAVLLKSMKKTDQHAYEILQDFPTALRIQLHPLSMQSLKHQSYTLVL